MENKNKQICLSKKKRMNYLFDGNVEERKVQIVSEKKNSNNIKQQINIRIIYYFAVKCVGKAILISSKQT